MIIKKSISTCKGALFLGLVFLFLSTGVNRLLAQNFVYSIRVDEVDFLAPNGYPDYKLSLSRDYDPHPLIEGPAWKYPATENPVAFISSKEARINAQFELNGCTGTIWAKGDGPGGYDPPAQQLVQGLYPTTALPIPFPSNVVDFYDPFEITWYISNSPNGPWIDAGKSKNPLYVVHSSTPINIDPVFHSVIYYGCKNAKGLTVADQIVDDIYTKTFSTSNLSVPRRDLPTKSAMSYWIWPDPDQNADDECYFFTQDLLKWENGRCGAWAHFFHDMISVQGIPGAEISAVTYAVDPAAYISDLNTDINAFFGSVAGNIYQSEPAWPQFFVKKFKLTSNKFYTWDREWEPYGTSTNPISLPNGNVLEYSPENGNPAQGNPNPMSTFLDHGIVKYNGKYYDPSYGTAIQNSANDWETTSLSGFGNGGSLNYVYILLGFQFETKLMWLRESNNSSLQSNINP